MIKVSRSIELPIDNTQQRCCVTLKIVLPLFENVLSKFIKSRSIFYATQAASSSSLINASDR